MSTGIYGKKGESGAYTTGIARVATRFKIVARAVHQYRLCAQVFSCLLRFSVVTASTTNDTEPGSSAGSPIEDFENVITDASTSSLNEDKRQA